jgi:uncharacterized protein (TIGR03435 family)
MLQSLVADRFKLKLHREMKEVPVYALIVGKRGPKFELNPEQTSPDVNGPAAGGSGAEPRLHKDGRRQPYRERSDDVAFHTVPFTAIGSLGY